MQQMLDVAMKNKLWTIYIDGDSGVGYIPSNLLETCTAL